MNRKTDTNLRQTEYSQSGYLYRHHQWRLPQPVVAAIH